MLKPLLDSGLASLETGGSLRDGRDVWMLVRFNWDEGVGHAGDRSMDEAYNAAVESRHHDGALWRVRGPRTGALLDERLAEIKDRVLNTLVHAASSN